MRTSLRFCAASFFCFTAFWIPQSTYAAEQGKSIYLLGVSASMAGMTPPAGTYLSSFTYFYSADATGAAALSRILPGTGSQLPAFTTLQTDANLRVKANVALDVFSALWVAPEQVLGGRVGFGALLPVGYQKVDVDVTARSSLTFPDGTILARNGIRNLSDNTFAIGDPLATAFIGWDAGNWHWKLAGLIHMPVGSYRRTNLVNMGFNRWAADITGSATWLDPKSGYEVSMAAGFTFNGYNPESNYRTGTEFHLETALMKHVSKDFAFGAAGYFYRQITGDSGSGAVLGSFKGEVAAIGPNLTYNFKIGTVPVLTSFRWLHEFRAVNRMRGDAAFLTMTVPLGGPSQQAH